MLETAARGVTRSPADPCTYASGLTSGLALNPELFRSPGGVMRGHADRFGDGRRSGGHDDGLAAAAGRAGHEAAVDRRVAPSPEARVFPDQDSVALAVEDVHPGIARGGPSSTAAGAASPRSMPWPAHLHRRVEHIATTASSEPPPRGVRRCGASENGFENPPGRGPQGASGAVVGP